MENHHSETQNLIMGHLIDQAGIAYLEVDKGFCITSWNRGAASLFGMDRDAVLGRRLDDIIPLNPRDLGMGDATGNMLIAHRDIRNRPVQYQVHYISIVDARGEKDGTALLIREGDLPRDACVQSSLKARSHSMEDILGFAPVGIFHVGLDGDLAMANSEFAWMLGYESSDHLVQAVDDFAGQVFFDGFKAEEFMFILMEAERITRFRCRLKRRDNARLWALCYAMVTFDEQGRANGFNGYAIDINDTIRAENALQKANEELMRLSVIDGLTQISNRRQFDAHLAAEWQGHLEEKKFLSVILCDIDFFKNYNDAYGHQAGDDCLCRVAGAIDSCARSAGGLAARYGGEEFGIILPEADRRRAMAVAERIRARVSGLKIQHRRSGVGDHVTLSLGIGTAVPGRDTSGAELLTLADTALYTAKEEGRNRTVSG